MLLLSSRHRAFVAIVSVGVCAVSFSLVAGCGGGNGKSTTSTTRATAPTQVTRDRVQSLNSSLFRTATQIGYQPTSFAYSRNSLSGGYGASTPTVGDSSGATASVSNSTVPLVGAFLRNIAASSNTSRHAAIHSAVTHRRGESTSGTPDPISVSPTFYYDYYLGLWVEITETNSTSTYALYEDEAKTKPAGSIETTWAVDDTTFPQVYQSSYSFTAGYLAGSHGASTNTNNADGSGSAHYDDVYADGWSDKGQSSWSGQGDYSYSSRTQTAASQWTESRGSFRADGGGGTHMATSDGYAADYVYNTDGSGHGTITGPDPGLPVTISWDAYGNTTIRYADGTIETIPGWGGYTGGEGGGVVPVDGGVAVGTTVSSSTP